eukprot:2296855-Pyramimonas_sp.AAC.1
MRDSSFGLRLGLSAVNPKLQRRLHLAFRALQCSEPVRAALLGRARLIDRAVSPRDITIICCALRNACASTS